MRQMARFVLSRALKGISIGGVLVAAALPMQTMAGNHQPDLKEFKVSEIKPAMYLLQGKGGNIFVLDHNKSLLVIDNDYAENSPLLKKTLDDMGTAQYVINTHWHGDHTGGNKALGEESIIVAHDNVRKRLSSPQEVKLFGMKTQAQPEVALPEVTYDNNLSIHHGGQHFKVSHFATGHTDGDSVVFIQPANIVHMGDHYFNGIFPFVDVENGGSVKGVAKNVEAILGLIDDNTIVIPGHGTLSNKQELTAFLDMLNGTTAFVEASLKQGLTLKQIQDKGLPEEWKPWGNGFLNEPTWISIVVSSLQSN